MIVGFTGTQEGMTAMQFRAFGGLVRELELAEFLHGCCVGADEEAHWEVRMRVPEARIHAYPGLDERGGSPTLAEACLADADAADPPAPYLRRNLEIAFGCEVLVACPRGMREEVLSRTWATVRAAQQFDRPGIVVWPDGRVERLKRVKPT